MVDDPKKAPYALRMVVDGKERKISYEELALSNNLAQEALVRLLVKKKLIKPEELLEEILDVVALQKCQTPDSYIQTVQVFFFMIFGAASEKDVPSEMLKFEEFTA